jgi:hypothetical protein
MSTSDIGLLVTIAASAKPSAWDNVLRSMRILRPRFSSIAIDLWLRPAATSNAAQAQRHVESMHSRALSLFSRVEWLDTDARWSVPRHVRPSFSYWHHWHRASRALRASGAPTLLAGLDADYVLPEPLPLARIAQLLAHTAAAHAPSPAMLAALEARARRLWVDGIAPACTPPHLQPLGVATPAISPSRLGSLSSCEVASSQRHRPLYVSPRRLSLLQIERAQSFGELTTELRPLRLGVSVLYATRSQQRASPERRSNAQRPRARCACTALSCCMHSLAACTPFLA